MYFHKFFADSNDQRRGESDVRRVRPEVLNILRPLSKRMLFSDLTRTLASQENFPGEKCHVKDTESKIYPAETGAIKRRNNNLNTEDSTDSKNLLDQSNVQSGSVDLHNKNLDTVTSITAMMNRTAKELDSAFQEADSQEVMKHNLFHLSRSN